MKNVKCIAVLKSPYSSTFLCAFLTCMSQRWPPHSQWSWTSPVPDRWTSCHSWCSMCHHKHCGGACSAHRHTNTPLDIQAAHSLPPLQGPVSTSRTKFRRPTKKPNWRFGRLLEYRSFTITWTKTRRDGRTWTCTLQTRSHLVCRPCVH